MTPKRIKVLNIITRMIVGGAQETPLLSCALSDASRFETAILSGIETGPEGQLHDECKSRGVRLIFLPPLIRALNPRRDVTALLRLIVILRRERPDVVHTHSSKAGILGRIAAKVARVPVVVHTVHGWSFNPQQSKRTRSLYIFLERFCARFCDALIVVAEPDREEGLKLGIGRKEQYHLVRSGIEVEEYQSALSRDAARARLGVPSDAFIVGSVARLSPQKSPLDLLDAFEILARARPDAHLVLCGDGPLRAEVEAAIAAKDLQERVHLLGLRRDVPEILRAFDVFALASRWEGLPRVFPQAMAAQLPIVATRVAGAPDAIEEGDNGFLVEVGQAQLMGERLLQLAQDAALLQRMGKSGRAKVEEFSAQRMTRQLEELYAALLKRRVRA